MKLLRSNAGSVAVHASSVAVRPEKGLNRQALVDFVGELYDFSVRPTIPSALQCFEGPMVFLGGRIGRNFEQFSSLQLAMFPDRHTVAAKTTDVAETVLYDLTESLNEMLDYRFDLASSRLTYASSLVVDFERLDPSLSFHKIADLLNSSFPRLSSPFQLKKLVVAQDGVSGATGRSENLFFSSAPIKTSAHVQLLERIEDTLAN